MKPEWLLIAEAEIGVREVPGDGDNARVLEYHATTTLHATDDEVSWCASFVGWVLLQVGIESTRSARARSYLDWGREIAYPPLGAIVVLARGTNPAQGHVGFLAEREGDRVLVLGGNQDDAVNVRKFPASSVLGYRWPC